MQRKGILAAGNFIVDVVKMIDRWPAPESLANIHDQYWSNGGGAYNVLKNLAALQVDMPLAAAGLVGQDHWGQWITSDCEQAGIDTSMLRSTAEASTSYTDVMTVKATGQRTFFHNRGANALLGRQHLLLAQSDARIFHLAYLLLLDELDREHPEGHTEASLLLQQACQLGFCTSVDLVSVHDARFGRLVKAALPFIDLLFLNELEAAAITGLPLTADGQVQPEQALAACRQLIAAGVRQWVLLHFASGVIAVSATGQVLQQGSVQLPHGAVVGTVGAGDAFAAGVLAAWHQQQPMPAALQWGVCAAAACLQHATCSAGILPMDQCLLLGQQYGYRSLEIPAGT
ncbi:MAG: carbohydrate kinase family protein [Chitinophagaceae bacterium]|nr:carbohydrate kinase family protein [Chitinophagaceae bacterium]